MVKSQIMADRKISWPGAKDIVPFVFSSFLVFSGCAPNNTSPDKPAVSTQSVNQYLERSSYPELNNFPLKELGEFRTNTGRVRWLNFADLGFKPQLAEEIFRHFEEWPTRFPSIKFELQGQTTTATLTRRPTRDRILYLIPENAPVPSWWGNNLSHDAGTKVFGYASGDQEAVTIVRVFNPIESFSNDEINKAIEADSHHLLVTEACQSSLRLDALNIDYRQLQEMFCNSVGLAAFMRLHGYSYELYTRLASLTPMIVPNNQPTPYLVFSRREYEEWYTEGVFTTK